MRQKPDMFWKRLSVTKKLFAAIALTTVVIVAFMAVMVAISMRSGFSQYLLEAELERFDRLDAALVDAYDPVEPGWPELTGDPTAWRVFTRGNVQRGARNIPPPPGAPRRSPDPLQLGPRLALLDADGALLVGPRDLGGQVATRAIEATDADGQSVTVGWIALAAPEGGVVTADSVFLAGQFRSLILASLLAIAASALAAFLLARVFLAPARDLVKATQTLAAGDYAARMPNPRRDEFGELIGHFNALADSLEKAEKAERQWISDASHELQTPLAVLRAQIEALQDGVREPDERTLAEINGSIRRLSELVSDLNALSHAREGKLLTAMADEDLSTIVVEAGKGAEPALSAAGLTLKLNAEPGLVLFCDAIRMRQLLDNLMENARRYTEAPGCVSLALERSGDSLVLTVEDTVPAPPEDAMDKLFDRFYRADRSRARHLGGSGLGLSICRAIVLAHGGSIAASQSKLGGLAVRITLPRDMTS